MLDMFLAPENIVFSSALLLMLLIGVVQAIGLAGDLDADMHADTHGDVGFADTLLAWAGIVSGVAGVLTLALAGRGITARQIWQALGQPAALCGLGAGSMFACAAIAIKLATAELHGLDIVGSALVTLVVVMAIQTALHLAWIGARDRGTLTAALRSWRDSTQVGLLSALGSACWYTGFAAAPAALVRIVGQVEVIFTIGFAHFYLREPVRWREAVGLLLVTLGVVLALFATF